MMNQLRQWRASASHPVMARGLFFACVATLGAMLYGRTLAFPFVFDDLVYFVENPLAKDWKSFLYPFHFRDFAVLPQKLGLSCDLAVNFITRPVCYLTFFLNYTAGGFDPRGFRAVNIAIHCGNSVLIAHLLWICLAHSAKGKSVDAFSRWYIPVSTALLFLVHPLQTESVTYVIQRFTSLGTLFFLIALVCHLEALVRHRLKFAWRCGMIAALILGMLTKEFLFTAPIAMVMIDWLVMGSRLKAAIQRALPALALFPIIPALLLLTSLAQKPGSGLFDALHVANGPTAFEAQYQYALTQPSVILTYLRLLILPRGLNIDPDFPAVESLADIRVFLSIGCLVGLLGFTYFLYRKSPSSLRCSCLFAGCGWFFITLSIDSSFVPLPDLMAEHRSYLPSIGVFLALVSGTDLARTRFPIPHAARHVVVGAFTLAIITLSVATYHRNDVWRSPVTLWSDAASKSPNKARVHVNLGNAYLAESKTDLAAEAYRRAIAANPKETAAYNNLSTVQLRAGQIGEALQTAMDGLAAPLSIYHYLLHSNMGSCYLALRDYPNSERSLQKALNLAPGHRAAHFELARVYFATGDYDRSLAHLQHLAKLGPPDTILIQAIKEVESAQGRHRYLGFQ